MKHTLTPCEKSLPSSMKHSKVCCLFMLISLLPMVTGCIQVPLVAHGNCAISPAIDKLCLGSYWGYWITKSPQQLLDERAQKESGGLVSTSGMFKIEVEQNLLEDLVSVALMGLVVPVSVKCWMQEDVDAHALPVEVEHDRKALNQ